MNNRKEIDINTWKRKKQFEWFSSFDNPCYGYTVKMDVTNVVNYSKSSKTSFFINFLYILMLGLNSQDCMRIRYEKGRVYIYDDIDPTYIVMTKCGVFENCYHKMSYEYKEFYERCQMEVNRAKNLDSVKDEYNSSLSYNQYYITCLPNLDFINMSHPLPIGNKESLSVPRICWGKFVPTGDKYCMSLNITLSHALVDGLPFGEVFNVLQKYLDNAYSYFDSSGVRDKI